MKLKSIYVSSFGKLKDFSLEFSDGVNTVKEENGWGKSTLATFIKCIFYGLNDSKRNIEENERVKFRPWNSTEKFGGFIVFSRGGKDYKLERFFGNKQSEDTVRLFDAETGKEYFNTENIGKRLFEIDEDGFLSTTYLSQKDFEIKSNTSLTAKFNSNGDENVDEAFDKALKKVVDKKKLFKGRADSGLIPEIKNKIYSIDNKIASSKNASDTVYSLRKKLEDYEKKQEILNKQYKDYSAKLEEVGKSEAIKLKKERLTSLSDERNNLLIEKQKYDTVLCDNEVSNEELNDLEKSIKSFSALKEKKSNLEDNAVNIKTNKTPVLFGAISVFIILFGILSLFLINTVLGVIFSVVGALGVFYSCFLFFKSTGNVTLNKDLTECEKLLNNAESAINSVLKRYNLGEGSFELLFERLNNAVNNRRTVIDKISEIDKEIYSLSIDEDVKKEINTEGNFALQNQKLTEIKNGLSEISSNIAQLKAQINYNEENASQISALYEERQELFDMASEYENQFRILSLTEEYLKMADESLKTKYRAPLQNSLDKYVKLAISDDFKAVIDIDLKLSVLENGRETDTEYYSKGYKNLLEICKRFALIEVLFNKEKPFIVLDDPFTNLDEEKLKACTSLLQKLSSDYQILYFICHDSRRV